MELSASFYIVLSQQNTYGNHLQKLCEIVQNQL